MFWSLRGFCGGSCRPHPPLEHDGDVLSLSQTTHRRHALWLPMVAAVVCRHCFCRAPCNVSGCWVVVAVASSYTRPHRDMIPSLWSCLHHGSAPYGRAAMMKTLPSLRYHAPMKARSALSPPPLLQKRCPFGATPPTGVFVGYRSVCTLWLPILTTKFILAGAPLPPLPRVLPLCICSGGC